MALQIRGLWSVKLWRLWSAECASRVLGIFERERSSPSPRDAIDTAKAFARGYCSPTQLYTARTRVVQHLREAETRRDAPSEAARYAELAAIACCDAHESLTAVTEAARAVFLSRGDQAAESERLSQLLLLLQCAELHRLVDRNEVIVLCDQLESSGVSFDSLESSRIELQQMSTTADKALADIAVFILELPDDICQTASLRNHVAARG